jgi:hypothetical protein
MTPLLPLLINQNSCEIGPSFHTLNGQHQKACADVAAGLKLIRESTASVDPMLSHELDVRQATCKHARTIAGSD